jgi:hypothetical protein
MYDLVMKSIEQLRNEYPRLRKFSDPELLNLRQDLYQISRLVVEWWIEHELGSTGVPLGLLSPPEDTEYDRK